MLWGAGLLSHKRGFERQANALKASNGQSRLTTIVLIYCSSEERLLRKKLQLWFGTRGAAVQHSQASFIWPEMVWEASKLPENFPNGQI